MSELDPTRPAEWLEWSGLPRALNRRRAGAWSVFKKLVELDCRRHRQPAPVEISPAELAERCGLTPEATLKILRSLQRGKFIRCFLPDHPEDRALVEIRTPIATPIPPDEVARRTSDPLVRDPTTFRYTRAAEPAEPSKVQQVVDLYLNYLSQKVNAFVLEQIEIAARRFPLETIRATIERAARHELRSMGWVLKELIRDARKQEAGSSGNKRPRTR